MQAPDAFDPYAGNMLVEPLGPILPRREMLRRLTACPPLPSDITKAPQHVRMHMLMDVPTLHIPSPEGARVAESIDLMLRQGYRFRNPVSASTWSAIAHEPVAPSALRAPTMASVVVGHSGVGKTEAIRRALEAYGTQVRHHERFPKLVGAHYQVLWLSVVAPESGRLTDFAANLMIEWDLAFARCFPDRPPRFALTLSRERRDGGRMLDEWRQVAITHFLGVLHIDEVQNFFRLPTLAQRRKSGSRAGEDSVELSLIEDHVLKAILNLMNRWQIPLLVSGTPDGVAALFKRLSNAQRFSTIGHHRIGLFQSANDPICKMYLEQLAKYQYVGKPLKADDSFREVMVELSAGVRRLMNALWVAGQRIALERSDETFRLDDIRHAARTLLAPVAPAVAALRSGDPRLMRRYEDLMPRDSDFWNHQHWEAA